MKMSCKGFPTEFDRPTGFYLPRAMGLSWSLQKEEKYAFAKFILCDSRRRVMMEITCDFKVETT